MESSIDNQSNNINYDTIKLLSVSSPIQIESNKYKKKYAVKLKYEDKDKKIHNKTIRFGVKGVDDFVDHKDDKRLTNFRKRLRNNNHFLQSNFWREKILNSKDNLEEAFTSVIKELGVFNKQ
jgi:hypothetical protein